MSLLHAIDFEGTRTNGIVEYGIVTMIGGEITEIRAAECDGNFLEHLGTFVKLRRTGAFVGHNASVEDGLLRHYAPSPGFVGKYSNSSELVTTWGAWVDTMILYRTFWRGLPDYSLGGLIENFGLTEQLFTSAEKFCPTHKLGYHNAVFDALATCVLLKNLIAELRKNGIEPSDELLHEYSRPGKKA
jgi:DNA polymerase-3 subunit epsilon